MSTTSAAADSTAIPRVLFASDPLFWTKDTPLAWLLFERVFVRCPVYLRRRSLFKGRDQLIKQDYYYNSVVVLSPVNNFFEVDS